jgi:hypothetical protein
MTGFAGSSTGERWLREGDEFDAQDPFVVERPELFSGKAGAARGKAAKPAAGAAVSPGAVAVVADDEPEAVIVPRGNTTR